MEKLIEYLKTLGGLLIILFAPLLIWFIFEPNLMAIKIILSNLVIIIAIGLIVKSNKSNGN